MDDLTVHDVQPDLRVVVTREMPALPPALDAAVEALWRAAFARVAAGGAGELFNGRVFSADVITPTTITGHLTEFRRIVAQMEHPDMFDALRVRPLAVCGVLYGPDGVVFGRRHAGAVYQADMWQLPPAGSVDSHAVDADGVVLPGRQVLNELREEVGLLPGDVEAPVPLCVVEHPGSHVSDLGMGLRCRFDGAAICEAHARHGNGEYPTLRIVPLAELAAFVSDASDTMVAPAPIFLRRVGLL